MLHKIILLITALLFCQLSIAEEKCDDGNGFGRYQISTTYRAAGNWVFVTIIDTSTGEIVTQERYGGFKAYEKK